MPAQGFGGFGSSILVGLWLLCGPVASEPARSATPDPEIAGYVAVQGGRVWYRINGTEHFADGKMPLLVIHGGPGFSHHYLLTLTDLADERPVIFYDQLDSGNSDRPGEAANWTVDRFVDEIDHLRDALGSTGWSCWAARGAAAWRRRTPPASRRVSPDSCSRVR